MGGGRGSYAREMSVAADRPVPPALRPGSPPVSRRSVALAVGGGAALAVVLAGAYALAPDWRGVADEDGVIEVLQVVVMAAGSLAAFVRALLPGQTGRRRAWRVWLGVVGALVVAREFDLHKVLNPESLGTWGVRYRLDWWTDLSVPIGLKLLWAGVAVAIALAVLVPLAVARPKPVKALLRRERHAVLLAAAAAGYLGGYLADDILGRGLLVERDVSKIFEEVSELTGGYFFLLACLCRLPGPRGAGVNQDGARPPSRGRGGGSSGT